jgi:predicted SprT family Zn-dependent metalloprotease
MSNIQTVRDAVVDCIARAEKMYGVDMSKVQVRFDLKGTAAGMAGMKGLRSAPTCYLRFNTTMIDGEGYAHVLNDTVPHEVAHMVCFMDPRLGKGHNGGWARVCRALGGSGETRHNEEVVYAKGNTYEYTCTQGTTARFSQQRHNKIQRGVTSFSMKRGGTIDKTCAFELVGVSGNPVAAKRTPEAPVAAKVQPPVAATAPKTAVAARTYVIKAKPKGSKADLIRAVILRCKTNDFERSLAVDYGVNELGMTRSLARKYVNENWDKVNLD